MSFASEWIKNRHHSFCSVVVVAAGNSTRMGEDKLFLMLQDRPVLAWTLQALNGCGTVDEIIVVTQESKLDAVAALKKEYGLSKVQKIVVGGDSRTESALAGVSETSPQAKIICIHDGARPFVTREVVDDAVHHAVLHLAAVPGVAVKDTVKCADNGVVSATLQRESLRAVQTPQAFHADIIKAALTKAVQEGTVYTDDSAAVEAMGVRVHISKGSEDNIKITTPADLLMAKLIIDRWGGRPV